ncbi:MAG: ArnT family glycosyltransferase [Candidatus Brocadiales bacterium]
MDKNKITITLMNIKERLLNNPLFSKVISIVLSVLILSLTAYYSIKTPWFSLFDSAYPDTKQLIAETFKLNWVPVFLSRLPYVFYALILNFIALLIGNRILRWLKVDFDSNINKIIFSVPLGWCIYSIGIFYLGISGLLYKEAVYCFLTLLGVLSILEVERFFREWKALTATSRFKIDKNDLVFLPVIIIFFTVQLVTAFSPVWSIDGLVYHMALPKLYVKHHAIVHVPGFFYSTLPAHTEMLHLLGLITSGETLSKLFNFSISSMLLLWIFSIGNRYFSKGVGYLSAVIMMQVGPFFSTHFSESHVDAALGLFSLLGIYAFFMWMEERKEGRKEGYLYLSIVCCALAAATKIQGLFFVLLFFIGFLVTVKMDRQFLKRLVWCILAVGVIALPWYIRSWWLTGDPVFPLFYNHLGGKYWNEYSSVCLGEYLSSSGYYGGVKSFSDFIRIISRHIIRYLLPVIAVIFLIPTLITLRHQKKLILYLFFITFVYYIFVIFTSPQSRFFLVGYASMCIIGAYFVKTVWTRYLLTRIPIILCIVAFSIVSFFNSVREIEGPFFTGLGVLDRRQFYAGEDFTASTWVNGNLPQDSKILSWYWHGYHMEREYVLVNPTFQGILDFSRIVDASTFLKSIKELGITHLLYNYSTDFEPYRHLIKEFHDNKCIFEQLKEFLDKCVSELLESGKITQIKQIGSFVIYSVVVSDDE